MPTFGKKGKPSSGRRGRKLVETWPPEWKPLEECPQVRLGMIDPKIYDLDLEQFDPLDEARIFLQQLRDSRGYDLEDSGPIRVISPLNVLPPPSWKTDTKNIMRSMNWSNLLGLCIHCRTIVIFSHLMSDKFHQRKNDVVVKTVQAMVRYEGPHHYFLMEWRFRPGPPLPPPSSSSSDGPSVDSPPSSSSNGSFDDSPWNCLCNQDLSTICSYCNQSSSHIY